MHVYFDLNDEHIRPVWVETFEFIRKDVIGYLYQTIGTHLPKVQVEVYAQTLLAATYAHFYKMRDDVYRVVIEKEDLADPLYIFEADPEIMDNKLSKAIHEAVSETRTSWNSNVTPFCLLDIDHFCERLEYFLSEAFDRFVIELIDHMDITVSGILEHRKK